jgi:hypothetical protein
MPGVKGAGGPAVDGVSQLDGMEGILQSLRELLDKLTQLIEAMSGQTLAQSHHEDPVAEQSHHGHTDKPAADTHQAEPPAERGHSHGGASSIPVPTSFKTDTSGLPAQGRGADGEGETPRPGDVRDPAKANRYLAQIRQSVAKYVDIKVAQAAGYTKGEPHGSKGIFHFTNPKAAGDLSQPFALMYKVAPDGTAQLLGVHYKTTLDFGAGYKHSHPGSPPEWQHVWIDRTVENGAFGNIQGTV